MTLKASPSPKSISAAGFWLLGLLCLLLPLAVILHQLSTPSDGARISKQIGAWKPDGVLIHTYAVQDNALQDGDRVVAIRGKPLEAWLAGLFSGQAAPPVNLNAQPVTYTVLRAGERLDLPVRAVPQPVWAIVRAHWGVFLFALVFQLVAIFVFSRRPSEAPAQALFVWGMTCSHFYIWSFYRQIPDLTSPFAFWLYTIVASSLWISNWGAGLHLTLTFPRPLPIIQRRPGLLALPYLAAFLIFAGYLALSWNPASGYLLWVDNLQRGESLVPIALFIPTIWMLVHQYRRDRSGVSHKKIRLVVFSGLLGGGLTVFLYLLPPILGLPALDANLVGVILLLFPLSIAVAILRYQLFDIDFIIRRTLVYGVLTAALALIYFSLVTLLQALFTSISNQQSPISNVLSTLAIAALFSPLRRRVQAFIDRRFFRQRYNSEQILQDFSASLRNEVDLQALSERLLDVVDESLHPESATLWIKKTRS